MNQRLDLQKQNRSGRWNSKSQDNSKRLKSANLLWPKSKTVSNDHREEDVLANTSNSGILCNLELQKKEEARAKYRESRLNTEEKEMQY